MGEHRSSLSPQARFSLGPQGAESVGQSRPGRMWGGAQSDAGCLAGTGELDVKWPPDVGLLGLESSKLSI